MKLNKRLLALSKMANQPYQVVWDCCCDHGLLGFKILANGLTKQVNFVDVVPELIESLSQKLTKYAHHLPAGSQWQALCQDVAELKLEPIRKLESYVLQSEKRSDLNDEYDEMDNRDIPSDKILPANLVIISGVGGELMIDIITRLMQRYSGENIDFLLCPVQHTYKLRLTLIELGFNLKQEQLIIENNRGYELMLINQLQGEPLSVTGNKLWKSEASHEAYLSKLINHYKKMNKSNRRELKLESLALKDYLSLQNRLYKNI